MLPQHSTMTTDETDNFFLSGRSLRGRERGTGGVSCVAVRQSGWAAVLCPGVPAPRSWWLCRSLGPRPGTAGQGLRVPRGEAALEGNWLSLNLFTSSCHLSLKTQLQPSVPVCFGVSSYSSESSASCRRQKCTF